MSIICHINKEKLKWFNVKEIKAAHVHWIINKEGFDDLQERIEDMGRSGFFRNYNRLIHHVAIRRVALYGDRPDMEFVTEETHHKPFTIVQDI